MAEIRLQDNENQYRGLYPSVFKKINSSDVTVAPFQVYKSWTIYSGSATSSLLPLQGIYTDIDNLPALQTELIYNDASNIDGSLQSVTYFSVNHLFYKYKDQPANTFGPTDLNKTNKSLFQTASIFSIPQNKIGERIKPASFYLSSSVSGSFSSDRYGNIYDSSYNTSSIVTEVKLYEGFNEYFDPQRIKFIGSNVEYVAGIPTTTGQQRPLGLAAKFNGNGYINKSLDGNYDRDHDYAISFFISSSTTGATNQLILAKASSSITPAYPFKIELNSNKRIVYSAAGSTSFITQISSSTAVSSSWNHIVCQKVGNTMQLYVNGALNSTITSSLLQRVYHPLSSSARIDNNHILKIGGYDTITSNLTGLLDEIRIFNKSLTTTEINNLGNRTEGGTVLQTRNVGNVFASQGIVVFSSADYRIHNILKTPYTASYRSTVSIYEMNVVTKLDAGDFNMSMNTTLTQDNDQTYLPFVSGSSFAPYITTIGLYNDFGQLLAIGKLAQPIRKRNDVDMNFLIRLDLDKNVVFKG